MLSLSFYRLKETMKSTLIRNEIDSISSDVLATDLMQIGCKSCAAKQYSMQNNLNKSFNQRLDFKLEFD